MIVDNNPLVRTSLIMMLGGASDIRVIGAAGEGAAALDQIQRQAPQVILIAIRMPIMDGGQRGTTVGRIPRPPANRRYE